MMKDSITMYWKQNPEWYRFNKEKDQFELTEKAPKEARDSFEIYMMPRSEIERRHIPI